jgi:hypothetical protein
VLAGVWFLADRITYDCTLIDDDDDASGQGLLDGLSSRDGEASGTAEQGGFACGTSATAREQPQSRETASKARKNISPVARCCG